MEETFVILKKNAQNSVENLMKWMKVSKIIDNETEPKARGLLKNADQNNVELKEFEDAVKKLADEHQKSVSEYIKLLEEQSTNFKNAVEEKVPKVMEEQFENLRKQGKNSVDNLIKWMKDSKIVDDKTEASARKYLQDAKDVKNVQLPKFKEALGKIAEEQKKNIEVLTTMLSDNGPKFVNAIKAGVSAFKDAMDKK